MLHLSNYTSNRRSLTCLKYVFVASKILSKKISLNLKRNSYKILHKALSENYYFRKADQKSISLAHLLDLDYQIPWQINL